MKLFALDAHPGTEGFSTELLASYLDGAAGADIETMALRDMDFDPILHEGYRKRQEWEPDIARAMDALKACEHFVLAFPMWGGSQPALLKGFLDRALMPGVAFKYRGDSPFWDRLLAGRSATALITGDTPGWFLRFRYGGPIAKQVKRQVLDFCGFKPAKVHYFGPVKGQKEETFAKWRANARRLGAAETRAR